jgi:hypothetical protein
MEQLDEIEKLKSKLTGDIFKDGEIMQQIYELKKQLNPEIETNPELDENWTPPPPPTTPPEHLEDDYVREEIANARKEAD